MMFLFAYLGGFATPQGWPVQLMYLTEAAFVIVAFVCIVLAGILKGSGKELQRDMVALAGGVSASFGLIMPLELAPFFFGARGEIMLGTIVLILFYPVGVVLFILLFQRLMRVAPPPLPLPARRGD